MLPAEHRLRRSADFARTIKHGRRARRGSLVIHLLTSDPVTAAPAEVGLVVGRGVGNSVVRHRTSRRLRSQLSARLGIVPAGARVVVRALPGAEQATSAQLGADLDAALDRLSVGRPAAGRPGAAR